MATIKFLYDAEILAYGHKYPVSWDTSSHIHTLVVGATNSGKTYAIKLLLGKLSRNKELNCRLYLLDFKGQDFKFLENIEGARYYPYSQYLDGLQCFYKVFKSRLDGNPERTPIFLILEEYGAFITSLERKAGEQARSIVAEILFLGRALSCHVICGLQRAEASYFNSGARDQFSQILALGNISKEQRQMLFSEYKDEMTVDCGRGRGYLLQDGKGIRRVVVPAVKSIQRLEQYIRLGASR